MSSDWLSRGPNAPIWTQLWAGSYPGGNTTFTTQDVDWSTFVVMSVDMINTDMTAGAYIQIGATGLNDCLFAGGETQPNLPWYFHWRGQLVLAAGDMLFVSGISGGWTGQVSGIQLGTNPQPAGTVPLP